MIRKTLQPFYTGYVIIIFMATLFIVLPFYLLFSIPNNKKYRKKMWQLTRIWSRIWLWLTGMPVRVIGSIPDNDRYIIVANHVSYLDPIVIFDILPFYFRPLAKKELSKAPVFGFIYSQLALMVDRGSPHSRAKSMRLMWRALRNECSIFIYPEGTFNETEDTMKSFYDGAFRLAINSGKPILPILFPDTKDRWHNSNWWKISPGRNRAFVLDAIPVSGLTINDISYLKNKVYKVMSEEMENIKATEYKFCK